MGRRWSAVAVVTGALGVVLSGAMTAVIGVWLAIDLLLRRLTFGRTLALGAAYAVALIAVVGLTVAVVVLAGDDQQVSSAPADVRAAVAPRPDESKIAAEIAGAEASRPTGGPDESKVADAIAGD